YTQQEENKIKLTKLASKKKSYLNIKEGIEIVERSLSQFRSDHSADAVTLDLTLESLLSLEVNELILSETDTNISTEITRIKASDANLEINKNILILRRNALNTRLNGPQQAYQQYLELLNT